MWVFQWYIQRGKKPGSGQFGSMYSLYPTYTSERASFTKIPRLWIYVEKYFLPTPPLHPPKIPPIFPFWTHFLPPKWIWSIITPWLNHKTELQTAGCRDYSGLPRILTCGSACCVCWGAHAKKNNLYLLPHAAECQGESFSLKEFQRQCLGIGSDNRTFSYHGLEWVSYTWHAGNKKVNIWDLKSGVLENA